MSSLGGQPAVPAVGPAAGRRGARSGHGLGRRLSHLPQAPDGGGGCEQGVPQPWLAGLPGTRHP